MAEKLINLFTSKEYRFLQWLAEQPCVELNGKQVVRMSQSQLAEAYGASATTVFHWIENLKDANCVAVNNKKSGYIVTPAGHKVIAKLKELERVIDNGGATMMKDIAKANKTMMPNSREEDVNQEALPISVNDPMKAAAVAKTYIDFFSGCGGLSLGLGFADWKGIFAVEKDPMAYSTFDHNLVADDAPYRHFQVWPDWLTREAHTIEDVLGDSVVVKHFKELEGHVTLVAGGPPCQGFSVAGARNGNDPRNLLVFKQIQAMNLLKPIYGIIENVGGFERKFVSRPIDDMTMSVAEEAVNEIEQLGYNVGKVTINAADYGVPQLRKRVILFAISKEFAGELSAANLLRDVLKDVGMEQRIALHLATDKYVDVGEAINDLAGENQVEDPEFPQYKTCKYLPIQSAYQQLMRKNIPQQEIPSCHRFNNHSKKTIALYNKAHKTQPVGRLSKEFLFKNGCHSNKRFVFDTSKPCSTLTTAPEELIHYKHPRVVTLREMARLQSFPDDFVFHGRYTLNGPARGVDVPRNAQIGNAIPPLVGRALGAALEKITQMVLSNDSALDQYRKK
ncbi:MAG: DNA (cytosine-5-)-methyltransferase [Peptococcaceae bacterium]|nr:DNA (cytosine-5-)-methyltransferase [Peptococcaceae bacterium]